ALSPLGPVLKTQASQNNETGVPKALLQLNADHKAAVIEMGMRGSGQIAYLCGIARPTVGVITVIADNHLELLGSQDAIADAKGELLEALPADGVAVLNADDPYYQYLLAKIDVSNVLPMPYGTGVEAVVRAVNVIREGDNWRVLVHGPYGEDNTLLLPAVARHDVHNALAALTGACAAGVSINEAIKALATYIPPPMRMEIVKTNSGVTVLNDAYNAAPASVKSALETLAAYPGGRKIAFLGDMRELGARADEAHRELGGVIADLGGLDALYTVGGLAAQIPDATQRFADSEEAARFVREALSAQQGDVILVKGSRAMAMEKIVAALTAPEAGAA
ncbi:MAG: UDP-N-acetylmuramoyl-tripeptide--D-alanyl-D-alanine ligase, partial [Armatimonadota bacterium]|nr:UDP-N-acetylmuramoyl-tripeptide--D-alanyl-D-alanine ligase [Armatimonadota bacterium]